MPVQVAVGGKNAPMTPEKRINLMLEHNINVFILRWKKVHEFKTSYFGFEILRFIKRVSGPTRETTMTPRFERGELWFEPDENDVPVAYAADTPHNRQVLAMSFYSSHYVISGLIKPDKTVSAVDIQKEIEDLALKGGIVKPKARKLVGVYGDTIAPERETPQTKVTLEPAKSVFGSEAKLKETMAEATRLTVDECFQKAEADVYGRYKGLIQKLQKEQPKFWKSSKYYKDVVEVEVLEDVKGLLAANGHPEDSKPTPPPPAAESAKAEMPVPAAKA